MPLNNPGTATTVVGLQWGDEAKGNLVQRLEGESDIVVNVNGGDNAGSGVIYKGNKITLSLVSSAVFTPGKLVMLGNNVVLNPISLDEEIVKLRGVGVSVRKRMQVMAGATIVQPHQRMRDLATMGRIGTTGKGIGAAYSDRAARMLGENRTDIRAGDVFANVNRCVDIARANLRRERDMLPAYGLQKKEITAVLAQMGDLDALMDRFAASLHTLRPLVQIDPLYVQNRIREGMNVLLKCSQGAALCIQNGTAPYQTSSQVSSQAAAMSVNVPTEYMGDVWGAAKFPVSRVGEGAFPTEIGGDASRLHCQAEGGKKYTRDVEQAMYGDRVDEMLASGSPLERSIATRIKAKEYGERTGRPRRMGYPDGVELRTMALISGVNKLFVSKLDCLHLFGDTVPLAVQYRKRGTKKRYDFMPSAEGLLDDVVPVYEHFEDCGAVEYGETSANGVPYGTMKFLRRIEELVGAPIMMAGTGPEPESFIHYGVNGVDQYM